MLNWFLKQSQILTVFIGVLLVLSIGVLDYITGYWISFSIFYILPIGFITWTLSKSSGIVFSLMSTCAWFTADILSEHEYEHPLIPIWNAMVRFGFFIIVTLLLHRLKVALDTEKKISRTDFLTGVSNIRAFYAIAKEKINDALEFEQPLTIGYLDLDNFKDINDEFGHQKGNEALKVFTKAVKEHIRSQDVVARLGGDEFVILLPGTAFAEAKTIFTRLHEFMTDEINKSSYKFTVSIGVVTFSKPPASVNSMVKEADNLMYVAKKSGKNRIEFRYHDGENNGGLNNLKVKAD
ncbi:GGDEF domain-containing protein [bacterium]|nr:GGDEF domain-containing protein [bacterium]